jgi:hypothetical protein
VQALRVFVRDGFIDRYSGNRLLFPPVLRLLSVMLPDAFPFHCNWKMNKTHPAYWELFPTLDHIVPVARGGPDHEDNLVSTSMLRNSAKANLTLEELGWSINPPGDMNQWDGMLAWCVELLRKTIRSLKTSTSTYGIGHHYHRGQSEMKKGQNVIIWRRPHESAHWDQVRGPLLFRIFR